MKRSFVIFTEDGARRTIKAPTLRTALRNFDGDPGKILAAVDVERLPKAPSALPFFAVLLSNPSVRPKR
jgi:hypothetical protein